MTLLSIPTDEQTLALLRELAAREHLSPEDLAARLLKNYAKQHGSTENETEWAAIGLFASGQKNSSIQAEEILESEWKPD